MFNNITYVPSHMYTYKGSKQTTFQDFRHCGSIVTRVDPDIGMNDS